MEDIKQIKYCRDCANYQEIMHDGVYVTYCKVTGLTVFGYFKYSNKHYSNKNYG